MKNAHRTIGFYNDLDVRVSVKIRERIDYLTARKEKGEHQLTDCIKLLEDLDDRYSSQVSLIIGFAFEAEKELLEDREWLRRNRRQRRKRLMTQKIGDELMFEKVQDGYAFLPLSPWPSLREGEAFIKSKRGLGRDSLSGYAWSANRHPTMENIYLKRAYTNGPFKNMKVRIVGWDLMFAPKEVL